MTDQPLLAAFRRAGSTDGFSSVEASFHPFKEFKAQWTRRGDEVNFLVTDYLERAPPVMLDDFAGCMFQRMRTKRRSEMYSPRMKEWMLSDDFVKLNRPLYLQRSRNLARSHAGRCYDLREGLDRLKAMGLVSTQRDPYLTWTRKPNLQRLGYTSVLMKVVAISSAMDDSRVPQFVSDYVLHHEMIHISDGLRANGTYHDTEFHRREKAYPHWREAEAWLKRLASGR
ncbi:MAG: hypothetical protein A4E32_00958 [Methanomassiliicoccales archaeon PtaU1.Bin124]|nr:MAG: hypothetical protein A4E32_00958 [Methanomassiliicoccales archaeon PtaU1.Bin124]